MIKVLTVSSEYDNSVCMILNWSKTAQCSIIAVDPAYADLAVKFSTDGFTTWKTDNGDYINARYCEFLPSSENFLEEMSDFLSKQSRLRCTVTVVD